MCAPPLRATPPHPLALPKESAFARSELVGRRRHVTSIARPIERAKADSFGKAKGWGGVARKGGAHISSTGQAMEVTPSTGRKPDQMSTWSRTCVRPRRRRPPRRNRRSSTRYPVTSPPTFARPSSGRRTCARRWSSRSRGRPRPTTENATKRPCDSVGIVADAVPGVAPVRELTGLAAYRAERWNMAKIHLRAHFTITGDAEHLPLVMDCDARTIVTARWRRRSPNSKRASRPRKCWPRAAS